MDPSKVSFNTALDPQLVEVERQVDMLEEELRLKSLQESAAEEEGIRKKTAAAGAENKESKSIFVAGFDPRTTEADLRLFFSSCGTISRITVLHDKITGQSKGSAYMEFETAAQAQASLLKDGQSLHGKPLKVAVKRDNIPGFHRGGFQRGRGAGNPMQMATLAMLSLMGGAAGGGGGFSPFPRGRGRGGRGGPRGRGGY